MKTQYVQFQKDGNHRRYTNLIPNPKDGYVHKLSQKELRSCRGYPPHLWTMGDDGFVRPMTAEEIAEGHIFTRKNFFQQHSAALNYFVGAVAGGLVMAAIRLFL